MVTRPNSTSSAIGTVIVPYSWLCLRCIVAVRFIGYTPLCHGISKLYQPKRITLFWNPWLRQGQILSLFLSLLFYCSKPRNSSNSNSSGAVFSISFTVAKPLCSKNQSRSSFAISLSWNIAAHAHKKPLSKICCLLSFFIFGHHLAIWFGIAKWSLASFGLISRSLLLGRVKGFKLQNLHQPLAVCGVFCATLDA